MKTWLTTVAVTLGMILFGACAEAQSTVHVLDLNGMIEPAVAQYVELGIDRAEREGAEALVIRMDTPGGLMDPMRDIVQDILNAKVPVIVYVSPNGARAASAGVFITLAANIAAMAPVTNIGSAHPVLSSPLGSDSPKPDDTIMKKVENDAAKYVVSIAERRGRNAKWAEKAVRESDNITAKEAVKMTVVDFIAEDMDSLLAQSEGRKVRTGSGYVTMRTRNAKVEYYPMAWYKVLLHYLANPLVAFFLMLIAIYGIIFEINTPGATIPGVVGGIAAVLLLYSFSVLPLNATGLILVLVAIIFFVADIKIQSHGVLTAGGVIAFFLGSLMLFGSGTTGVSVPIAAIVAGTLSTAAFFAFLVGWGRKALQAPVVTGREGMIGQVVTARTDIAPTGKIFAEGTWWSAETEGEPIKSGEKVRIVGIEGLKVKVEKDSGFRGQDSGEKPLLPGP